MKAILIGLVNANYNILKTFLDQDIMPFLKQFISSGVSASLISTAPQNIPTVWTSLITGRSQDQHGIMDFTQIESPESKYLRANNSGDVKCETIWSIMSRNSLRVASLNFPLMAPPIAINGYIIPGWINWRYIRYSCYPDDLYDELKKLPFFYMKELSVALDLENKDIEDLPEEEWEDLVKLFIRKESYWFEILRYIITEKPLDFAGIIFDGAGKLIHLFGKLLVPDYLSQKPSTVEKKVRELCLDYFSQLDSLFAEIVALAGPNTQTFLVSAPIHAEGIFLASGHGISKDISIDPISILDVAPILLQSLGVAIPEDLEGHVPNKIFTSDFIRETPVKIGPPTIKPEAFFESSKLQEDKDAQEKVLQRLKKLGYIE
ncbi:hypothetical protein FJZ33_11695 [Candidatus Poribacteria bacterium]|nr:hypothetical protein [Candidatus Poribacteria bacterium]